MNEHRTLALRRERLAALDGGELARAVGGLPTTTCVETNSETCPAGTDTVPTVQDVTAIVTAVTRLIDVG